MFSMRVSGCCSRCEYADLFLEQEIYRNWKIYTLHCRHENVCGALEDEARERALKPDREE